MNPTFANIMILFLILAVGMDWEWVHRYRSAINQKRFEIPVWFTTLALVEKKGAVHRIWTSAQEEKNIPSETFLYKLGSRI